MKYRVIVIITAAVVAIVTLVSVFTSHEYYLWKTVQQAEEYLDHQKELGENPGYNMCVGYMEYALLQYEDIETMIFFLRLLKPFYYEPNVQYSPRIISKIVLGKLVIQVADFGVPKFVFSNLDYPNTAYRLPEEHDDDFEEFKVYLMRYKY